MSFTRATALRSLRTTLRQQGASRAAPRVQTQLAAKRFASSGGHGHAEPSSDLPWALGAIAITIPAVWYLWPEKHAAGDHHGGHHGSAEHHDEESQDKEEEAAQEESAPAEQAPESDKEEKSNEASGGDEKDSSSNDEGKSEQKEDKSSEDKSEGGKDPARAAADEAPDADSAGHNDERKTEPDSKGAYKKRIDSGLAQNLGVGSTSESSSPKQDGLSNTDTRHSVKIDESSEKSTKGEGAPETAKIKGAVDPSRPQK